jgi:hypothetical protein
VRWRALAKVGADLTPSLETSPDRPCFSAGEFHDFESTPRYAPSFTPEVPVTRTTALLAAAALFVGCTDRSHPMEPEPGELEAAAALSTAPPPLPPALIPVEDALSRVLHGLPDGSAKDELRSALHALVAALEADDGCAIRTSRREAEHALRDLGRRAPAEFEPDLDVTKLAIESVEQADSGRCPR